MPAVRGFFDDGHRRPYVEARVLLPRLGVSARIPLLVDTGADSTAIHWRDREWLEAADGRPLAEDATFAEQSESVGIAGSRSVYGREPALLTFDTEDGARVLAVVSVNIELKPSALAVPSLLGRDVLSEVRLDFNMPADSLVLEWPDDALTIPAGLA